MSGKVKEEAVVALDELREDAVHQAFYSGAGCLLICEGDYPIELRFIAEEISHLLRVSGRVRQFCVVIVIAHADHKRIAFSEPLLPQQTIQHVAPCPASRPHEILVDACACPRNAQSKKAENDRSTCQHQLSPLVPLTLLCFSLMISSVRVTTPVTRLTMEPARDSQDMTSDVSPLDSRPGGRRLAS